MNQKQYRPMFDYMSPINTRSCVTEHILKIVVKNHALKNSNFKLRVTSIQTTKIFIFPFKTHLTHSGWMKNYWKSE